MAFPSPNFSPGSVNGVYPAPSDFERDGAVLFQSPDEAWNGGSSLRGVSGPERGAVPSSTCSSASSTSTWDMPEPPSIGKALRNFRINGLFCDVALHFTSNLWGEGSGADVTSSTRPPPPPLFAHKVVLAACSPYFFSGLNLVLKSLVMAYS